MFKSALCSAASFELGIKAGIFQLMLGLPKLKSPASIMFTVFFLSALSTFKYRPTEKYSARRVV